MTDAPKGERPKLSTELTEYLVSLSVALQRHAMYPNGHPSLAPAVDAVLRRANRLLEDRPSLAFGVARRQLIVEGVTTDPEHPVLRRLAEELHRHHLGAVSVNRNVQPEELSEALRALASEPDRTGGLLPEWPHVRLHPLTFDGLALVGDAPLATGTGSGSSNGTLSAELWVGLARAAISADAATASEDVPLDPSDVAQSIDDHHGPEAYDQVIVGYMTQIARELRTSTGAETEALRRRASRLVKDLRPDTLKRILDMGGDIGQRAAFVLDSARGMTAEAALDVVKAAAAAGGQTISHSLLRMLSKLAAHTDDVSAVATGQPMAGEGLRDQVGRLLSDWTLEDPNPEGHRQLLQQFAIAARNAQRPAGERSFDGHDSVRVIQMSLESGVSGPLLNRAVDEAVALGQTAMVAALVQSPPAGSEAVTQAVFSRLVLPANLVVLLTSEPLDIESLDALLPHMTPEGYETVLDALTSAETRTTRRKLLDRLAKAPYDLSAAVVTRLHDERWYVQRNMLVLLERYGRVPENVSLAEWTSHPDPRLRSEAIRVQLAIPAERDTAIRTALWDTDPRAVRVGLGALRQGAAPELVSRVVEIAVSRAFDEEIRTTAVAVLGRLRDPGGLDALLHLADGGRTLFGRQRLATKTPLLVGVLRSLAGAWPDEKRAAAILAAAAASSDTELVEAVRPGRR